MRLYTIYKICKENIEEICNCETHLRYEQKDFTLSVQGWIAAKQALENVYAIDAFKEIAQELYNAVPIMYKELNEWEVVSKCDRNFSSNLLTLKNEMQGIIKVYESFGYSNNMLGIDVKMPTDDFSDFVNNMKSLEYILYQCPLLNVDDAEIEFSNVDVGSTWFNFILKGSGANFLAQQIAKLVDQALAIKSHWVAIKQQEEMLHTMELKNEMLESVKTTFDIMREAVMKNSLDELKSEDATYKNGEERDKTKVALEKMVDLLDKGMEIYASIDTPSEVQVLFPQMQGQSVLEGKTLKLLPSQEDNEEEN